jgi:biotin synthase
MSVNQVKAGFEQKKVVPPGFVWEQLEKKDGPEFDQVLEMVRTINKLEMEVCCTRWNDYRKSSPSFSRSGLYAYNHNLDTSEEYYKEVISTRGFEDRLQT